MDSAYIYKRNTMDSRTSKNKKEQGTPLIVLDIYLLKNYLSKPGHNIADLKNILGHKNISTTEIYLQKKYKRIKRNFRGLKEI